ncbi:MAG: cupin domain-containing protein [Candidatus Coatesbacteria bacterium]|nr:cupin domain-containing protein [Candidatus Coatesbacteria bacterium]
MQITWKCKICGFDFGKASPPTNCPLCNANPRDFRQFVSMPDSVQINLKDQFIGPHGIVDVNSFLCDYRYLSIFVVNLPVGWRINLHRHPINEEFCFIVKGLVSFNIGEKQIEAKEGDLVQISLSVLHGWINIGSSEAAVLRIHSPKPVQIQFPI